jgi:hypothetical protein
MRFVELKSEAQLDMQSLHRARDRLVGERTALINQLRAFLLERGIIVPQGRRKLELHLDALLTRGPGVAQRPNAAADRGSARRMAPSTCCLPADRVGMPRKMLARSSSRGSNPADVGPHLERTRPRGAVLAGGDVVAAEVEEIADLVVGGEETLRCRADLKRFICRSRRRVGWCEFSARLLRPLCRRCSTPGISSFFAAP